MNEVVGTQKLTDGSRQIRKTWIRPTLQRLSARDAENGLPGTGQDSKCGATTPGDNRPGCFS